MALEKGTNVAGYEVRGVLGQGGMGVVYEANQLSLKRIVALKILAPHLSEDLLFRERFRREGQLQAGIDHPHIVTVHEAGESEHGFFIAMRLIRGPNLKDMIVSRELDPGRTLRILSPIADALDTAHEAGLIHRDIKPQNILVGGRDQAFLADFGLTKAAGEQSLTQTGQFVGTFDYISPEQIKGERATKRSDVYALAAVLYECFTGVVPYPKDSEAALLYAHMADPPPKVTDQRPDLPATLDALLARGMSKDPEERYPSTGHLLIEANRAFTRRMRAAFTPPGPLEAPQETGIRPAEGDVSTRESPAQQESEPGTEEGALEAETVPLPAPTETLPAQASAAGTTHQAPPSETAPGGAAHERTAGSEAVAPTRAAPEARREPAADQPDDTARAPGEMAATVALPDSGARQSRGRRPGAVQAAGGGAAAAGRELPAGAGHTRPPPTRPLGAPALLAAAAGLLVLLLAGFLIGRSGGSEDTTPAASNLATAGPLELGFPNGWRRAVEPPAIPGLGLRDEIALSRARGPEGSALTAGTTAATGPALLPSALLDRLPEQPKRDDAVKLDKLDAYRYENLRLKGFEGRLTLYVVPTTKGVATVACTAKPRDAPAFLPDCEGVAASLTLTRGRAYALGPDRAYLSRLDETIGRLNSARSKDSRQLREAKTAQGQAMSAQALGGDYRQARMTLSGVAASPAVLGANRSVVEALAKAEAAYRRMASAARQGTRNEYDAARGGVRSADAALRRALRRVENTS